MKLSNYSKATRHPNTGKWEDAEYLDDYFAHHVYGVRFSDGKVYTIEMVQGKEIKEFWADDVIMTFMNIYDDKGALVEFLNELDKVYQRRWKADPQGGQGAVKYYQERKFKRN